MSGLAECYIAASEVVDNDSQLVSLLCYTFLQVIDIIITILP